MTTNLPCLRCQTPMEVGFLIDATHGGVNQARWAAGPPEQSTFLGMPMGEVAGKQVKAAIKVTTLRCPSCGYLESYAPTPTPSLNTP